MMIYTDSKQLIKEYKKLLIDVGITQQDIADKLGISRQALYMFTNKKRLSFDDMERLLAPLGYEIEIKFVKKAE